MVPKDDEERKINDRYTNETPNYNVTGLNNHANDFELTDNMGGKTT